MAVRKHLQLLLCTAITALSTAVTVRPAQALAAPTPFVCTNTGCDVPAPFCYYAHGCACSLIDGKCDGDDAC